MSWIQIIGVDIIEQAVSTGKPVLAQEGIFTKPIRRYFYQFVAKRYRCQAAWAGSSPSHS
jgi:hypothetical protein